MKLTGYALLALAVLMVGYAGVSHLIYDVTPVEQSGTENASAHSSNGAYWYALIPAVGCAGVGLYLIMGRERGYAVSHDMSQQQT